MPTFTVRAQTGCRLVQRRVVDSARQHLYDSHCIDMLTVACALLVSNSAKDARLMLALNCPPLEGGGVTVAHATSQDCQSLRWSAQVIYKHIYMNMTAPRFWLSKSAF